MNMLTQLSLRSDQPQVRAGTLPYVHPTELKIPGTREHLVSRDGHFSAYDNRDAIRRTA
jgi:hypothetical protein